jgi:glycosyltransferase involved in cell wall biosynthesis
MGVDTDRFAPSAASVETRRRLGGDGPALLFVGRLVETKGPKYAIEAMGRILREHPRATLTLIGEGPDRRSLERLSGSLGLGDTIRFLGALRNDELPAFYASADVLIGPSVVEDGGATEAFGLVFAEAMACGCPVVASDVGGVRDVVMDGATGVLVPQRDPHALGIATLRLLESDTARDRMRTTASAHARRHFDQRAVTSAYAGLLRQVMAA